MFPLARLLDTLPLAHLVPSCDAREAASHFLSFPYPAIPRPPAQTRTRTSWAKFILP